MITEQELKLMSRTIEEAIKDAEKSKEHDKHESSKIREYSQRIASYKVMLQVLHFAEGITGMLDENTLNLHAEKLDQQLAQLSGPSETDLFESENSKGLAQELSVIKTKQRALAFIFGKEKKLL
jgi:hypothetical protein